MPHDLGPGAWRLEVEIPIPSLRFLNAYAFELSDGSLGLIDTGWDDRRSLTTLERELHAIGRALEDVSRVAVTHGHPDHVGLAHHVRVTSGAEILLHEVEQRRLASVETGPRTYVRAAPSVFRRWGVEEEDIEEWLRRPAEVSDATWDVESSPVKDGERLPFPGWDLEVVWTPGHSPGHMCILERPGRRIFTGDHVLPRITPGVGVHPAAEPGDPLADFLDSLTRVAALDVDVAHPAHEQDFLDVGERAEELIAHHETRLNELLETVRRTPGLTSWQVAQQLSWRRRLVDSPATSQRLALTETQAHLVHLARRELIDVQSEHECDRWFVVA